ncbi:MAG: hypothetical protein JRN15_08490, partial [Nitrososphaerota archaeon]|nr:hypothetical protein [Nitrososphaerota archaeon]
SPIVSGSGASAADEYSLTESSDGPHYVSTNTTGTGTAAYSQQMNVANQIVIYAHNDQTIGENGGVIGNYTASYLPGSGTQVTDSANSSSQMVWSYVSYPAFPYNTVFPANSVFTLTTYLSANQTLTGVTYGVQVNEVCNGYSNETSPWGGEVTSAITVGTTPQAYSASVSTGSSNFTFEAGCALHLIVYVNPNTSHAYTFTIYYDSKSYETHTTVPYLPTVSRLDNAGSTMGFTLKPIVGTTGYFFAVVTNDGTDLFSSGLVNTNDVPNLISPVSTQNFTVNSADLGNWTAFNFNAANVTSNLNPNAIIEYIVFGVDSSSGATVYASWDDVFYIVTIGEGNAPAPAASGQYMVGGYYYANNGIVGLSNVSTFKNEKVYEQSMSEGIITADENQTTYGYLQNPSIAQAFGSSPFVSDFFVWDMDYNATGYMARQIMPYSATVGSVPYRLYVSGGNGTNLNIDFWIGVDQYRNIFVWINATIAAGQDYIEPSMTLVNLGVHSIQINDLNFGLGSFDQFMKYNPYWSYLELTNGTIYKGVHGFNDTSANPNSTIYTNAAYNNVAPQAMLWTGFQTPEFADGLLIKPLNASNVEEIDYVNNFFGHSLRFVMNENGKIIPPGGQSDTFSFQFTPLAKTLWNEPSVLLYAFQHVALTKPGVDISMPGSWGIDAYGLATWGTQSDNQTVLSFAKELWNSEYQDVIQRLHPAFETYNPSQQPVIYYRSLYSFGLAGLVLYPHNSTVYSLAQQIELYGIRDQLNQYGLPFGLEEDGWAVNFLYTLYNQTASTPGNQTVRAQYAADISAITNGFQTNTALSQIQSLSSWNITSSSYNDYTPSVWNLNASGAPNPGVYCNHPNIVFRCGEMSYGVLSKAGLDGLPNYWNSPFALTSFSLIQMMTNPQPTGLSVDVRYADNSGNSNTETDPVSVLGLLSWMNAMRAATPGGTFISSVSGAEISSMQLQPDFQ